MLVFKNTQLDFLAMRLYAENLVCIKIGMQFCVDVKKKKGSCFITKACIFNAHLKIIETRAVFEIVNRQKSKIQIYNSQRRNNSFFLYGILNLPSLIHNSESICEMVFLGEMSS